MGQPRPELGNSELAPPWVQGIFFPEMREGAPFGLLTAPFHRECSAFLPTVTSAPSSAPGAHLSPKPCPRTTVVILRPSDFALCFPWRGLQKQLTVTWVVRDGGVGRAGFF